MPELSPATKQLLVTYARSQQVKEPQEGTTTIHVDEVALKVAAFYEHIRTIVDWKEEHLMRRAAIIRKLKRRFFDLEFHGFLPSDIAEGLVMELIRGGYFPNDKLEESKISDVEKIINKYVFILKENPENRGFDFYHKLLEIAACEIEETLDPSIRELALIEYMFSEMKSRIKVSESIYERGLLARDQKDTLIYIAVQQSLFKLDAPIISYHLIKYRFPYWSNPSQQELLELALDMHAILQDVQKNLASPLLKKCYTICEKYDTAYLLIGDILSQASQDTQKMNLMLHDPMLLEGAVKSAYTKRLSLLKAKINRAAIYSTLSIFITKILSLLILEIILAKIFNQNLNVGMLAIDILIPTCLMALLVVTVKPPSKKNINLVIAEVMKLVFEKEKKDVYEVKVSKKRGVITRSILSLTYVMGAFISFGALYWIFNYFGFPISSIIINIIFIALILFAATAVRKRSRELTIEDEPSGGLVFLQDILFLPITSVGRWLSNTWKQYNAITAFFNALIDMPFSVFVEFLERWRGFIKDTKEELS